MTAQIFNFSLPDSSRWTSAAACAEEGVAPMFPSDQDVAGIEYAKAVCGGCPVRERCLSEALDSGERFGIWGGLTADERRTLKRQSGRKGAVKPGVPADMGVRHQARGYDTNPVQRPLIG